MRATWRALAPWPLLRALAVVTALAAMATVPYLGVRQVVPIARTPDAFVYDFSYYHEAARRPPAALYADPEFVYPPPSRGLMAPLGALPLPVALGVWMALNALLLAVGGWLTATLWARERGTPLPGAVAAAIAALMVGSGPAFQTLKYGQVNSLVLLSGLGFLALAVRGRMVGAGVALAAGFWLKLYPILLLPLAVAPGRRRRAAAGALLGLVGVPLLLLPWLPPALYAEFFGERLPHWSGLTSQGFLNGSLAGVLTRLTLPPEAALRALDVPTPPAVRAVVAAVSVALVGGLLLGWARGHLSTIRAGLLLLAAVPVVSPLGWEHAYVLALPLLAAVLVEAPAHPRWRVGVAVAAVALCLARPPFVVLEALATHAPRVVLDLAGARMLAAVLFLGAALVTWAMPQARPSATPRRASARFGPASAT